MRAKSNRFTSGPVLETDLPPHEAWKGEIYDEVARLAHCDHSDAQGLVDGQPFALAQQWALGASAKAAAVVVLKAATPKPPANPIQIFP